ncbi:hypothetical protein BX666DRAFT_1952362 [Dichotomocladium elegans]|nr:hypothetical protein BX666DRAFT_1952362 [Dichotomocladium elegans]
MLAFPSSADKSSAYRHTTVVGHQNASLAPSSPNTTRGDLSSSDMHTSWPPVCITNQPYFISNAVSKGDLLIEFMRQPQTFPISNDQDPPNDTFHLSASRQPSKSHEEPLLVGLMPVSMSVSAPDSNLFSGDIEKYSSVDYGNDSTSPLACLVYHMPQIAQTQWESMDKDQHTEIFFNNKTNETVGEHSQRPLITQEHHQVNGERPTRVLMSSSSSTSSSSTTSSSVSSAPRWPSRSPTATASQGSGGTNIPIRGDHQSNKRSFQTFASSASQQIVTAACIGINPAAHDNIRIRTNGFPRRDIAQSDHMMGSFQARYDGLNEYGVPSANLTVAAWLRPHLQRYLSATDPSSMGERRIVVLTGKVAQKSYGTEKRFLCPPPTVILDGPSWWIHRTSASKKKQQQQQQQQQQELTQKDEATPPKISVTMSGESETQEGQVDWFSHSGAMVGQTGFSDPPPQNIIGSIASPSAKSSVFHRAINTADRDWIRVPADDSLKGGKCHLRQLYINDTDEKRKQVECLTTIVLSNGVTAGTFASRPIKVISKPSKKRLSMKTTDSCIHHGAMVSLFNRIRSQTVSTKYLAVSTTSRSAGRQAFLFPGQDNVFQSEQVGNPCFTVRTSSWDPFVIWLVDTSWVPPASSSADALQADADEYIGSCGPSGRAGGGIPYPTPPAIALKNKTGRPLAIHYNQQVVLQCLTTGLVSPVMIIRKIDRASTVVGGANAKAYAHPEGVHGGECGDEILGDPVSQLHRVAFQVMKNDPAEEPASKDLMPRTRSAASYYLACRNDTVIIHESVRGRRPIQSTGSRDTMRAVAAAAAAVRPRTMLAGHDITWSNSSYLDPMNRSVTHHDATAARNPPDDLSRPAKRSRSAEESAKDDGSLMRSLPGPPGWSEWGGAYWFEDVSDSAVWTIAGTDCVKYTLWEPPGDPEHASTSSSILEPEPMLPAVFSYSYRKLVDAEDKGRSKVYIDIHGMNLSRDLEVWFGDIRSPQTEYHSREQIVCEVPSHSEMAMGAGASWKNKDSCRIPLLLAKRNGKAVYKTGKDYVFF